MCFLCLSHCHSCISWERTFINIMECHVRLHLRYQMALIQAQIDLLDANLNIYAHVQNRRRRRRRLWCRAWLDSDRRRQFGLYDQLMTELRREDQKSFVKFMRISVTSRSIYGYVLVYNTVAYILSRLVHRRRMSCTNPFVKRLVSSSCVPRSFCLFIVSSIGRYLSCTCP